MAKVLKREGRKVILVSPSDGTLSKEFRAEGVQVITSELIDSIAYKWPCMKSFCPSPIDLILCLVYTEVGVRPTTVLWNTIVWADVLALSSHERYCHNSPQNVWIIHEWAPEAMSYWQEIMSTWSEYRREAILGSDAMVFVSDKSKEQWQNFDGLVPFHKIPGYSEYTDGYVDVLNNVTRNSLNTSISDDAFVITSVGTIDRRKQQAWAIDAVAELRKKNVNAILLMIGSPEPLYFQQNVLPRQQEFDADIIRVIGANVATNPTRFDHDHYLQLDDSVEKKQVRFTVGFAQYQADRIDAIQSECHPLATNNSGAYQFRSRSTSSKYLRYLPT